MDDIGLMDRQAGVSKVQFRTVTFLGFVFITICLIISIITSAMTANLRAQVDALNYLNSIEKDKPTPVDQCKFIDINRAATPTKDIPGWNQSTGSIVAPGVASLGYQMDNGVKVFHLYAQVVHQKIFDANDYQENLYSVVPTQFQDLPQPTNDQYPLTERKAWVWGYNGASPGPVIEVNKGDRVRVVLHNELPVPTSIHWHGLEVDYEMDGSGGISQKSAKPGESFNYEFTITQCGTLMYHTGKHVYQQAGLGLGGMLVMRCPNEEPVSTHDLSITLAGLWLEDGTDCPTIMMDDSNWFTFNMKAFPSFPTFKANAGDSLRIRFINPAQDESHPIHMHGHTWQVIGQDGTINQPSAIVNGSTISVSPGATRDVRIDNLRPGVWQMHCHKLLHKMFMREYFMAHLNDPTKRPNYSGMFTVICVRGTTPSGIQVTC